MTVKELMEKLACYSPDAEVVVMSSHDDGDDLMDCNIFNVNDSWTRKMDGDMISLEITFDQRPEYI